MPRKAKEEINIDTKEIVKKSPSSKKSAVSTKKPTKAATSAKVSNTKKVNKIETKKATIKKVDKPSLKKVVTKKTNTTTKSTTNIKVNKSKKVKKEISNIEVLEYYDLPYRYNQTIIKILAQTPNTLFIYWDISDDDKNNYIKEYGEYFFNNTKPVLIIKNETMNYTFEVDINDYSNSWYLKINDSNCTYKIELGRRPINEYINIPNNYLEISSSNNLESPNDRILFEKLNNTIFFRDTKTNITIEKELSSISLFKKIGKIYSVKDFYSKMYINEDVDFNKLSLNNPTSANSTSTFK